MHFSHFGLDATANLSQVGWSRRCIFILPAVLCHCTAKALVIVSLVQPPTLVVFGTTVLASGTGFWVPTANPDRRVSFLFGTFYTAGLNISTLDNGWDVSCVWVRYHTIVTSR